jgi:hypothetical protein
MFLSLSFTKKLTLLCKCLFICLICCLYSFATIAHCLYWLILWLLTIAISFYALTLHSGLYSVCIKHQFIYLTWNQFYLIPNIYTMYYSWHVLRPTQCLYMWICGTQIKYQYQYAIDGDQVCAHIITDTEDYLKLACMCKDTIKLWESHCAIHSFCRSVLFLLHYNNGYRKAPHCYVIRTLLVLLNV